MMNDKFKVIIVDDEESARELIKLSIDWESMNYEVIGEANNSEEALALIEHASPDLVLTDIHMPYMDGIEFSEKIIAQYPEIKIIVITGYDDFEYAQRSIKAGVYDYIVKPIDEDEVMKALEKVYREIHEERKIQDSYGWLKEQLKKELPYLKEKFLVDLLYSHMEEDDYIRRKKFTEVKFTSSFFQVTAIEIEAIVSRNQESYLCYAFIDKIRSVLERIQGVELFIDNANNIILLNTNQANASEMNECIDVIIRRILNHPDIVYMIGIGSWYQGFNKVKLSYREALEAIANKIVSGTNQVIMYDDLIISKPNQDELDDSWENKLLIYIKSGVINQALDLTNQVFEKVMSQEKIQLKALRLKAFQILILIVNSMAEIGMNIDEKKYMGEDVFEELVQAKSLPDLKKIVCSYIEVACGLINAEHLNKQNSIIDNIDQFILDNMHTSLSLNDISDQFHINKSYLSRIYKERTGMTLGERILSKKMEKSIELLTLTDKKAYEIAEVVGYNDPNYFGNTFKKYTGKSISEFRKEQRKKKND